MSIETLREEISVSPRKSLLLLILYLLLSRSGLYLGSCEGERKSLKGVISLILVVFIVHGLFDCRTQGLRKWDAEDVVMNGVVQFRKADSHSFLIVGTRPAQRTPFEKFRLKFLYLITTKIRTSAQKAYLPNHASSWPVVSDFESQRTPKFQSRTEWWENVRKPFPFSSLMIK